MSKTDNPPLGILLMLGFCVTAPLADAVAKILGQHLPIGQLVFLRFTFQAVLLIPLTWALGRNWRMGRRLLWLTLARTILHIGGVGLMFTSLLYLPLADAVAIAFVMPFIALLLGWVFLGEEVGIRRLTACAVGFVGTLMVLQPAFAEVGAPALLPLGVAVIFALFMLVTRQLAPETDPIGMQAVSAVMAVPIIGLALILFPQDILNWDAIEPTIWPLLIAMGVLGTCGHLLMTWALRYAPAATLAPMQYLEIPVATLIGFWLFGDLPNRLAALGILVILGAGLYVVRRERAIAKARG